MAAITITCPGVDDSVNQTFDVTGTFDPPGTLYVKCGVAYPSGPSDQTAAVQTGTPWRVTVSASQLATVAYLGAVLLDGPNGNTLANDGPIRISIVSSGGKQC